MNVHLRRILIGFALIGALFVFIGVIVGGIIGIALAPSYMLMALGALVVIGIAYWMGYDWDHPEGFMSAHQPDVPWEPEPGGMGEPVDKFPPEDYDT